MKDFYNFAVQKLTLKLVYDMPDSIAIGKVDISSSNGANWVCKLDEWDSIGESYDNTWGIMDKYVKSSVFRPVLSH